MIFNQISINLSTIYMKLFQNKNMRFSDPIERFSLKILTYNIFSGLLEISIVPKLRQLFHLINMKVF